MESTCKAPGKKALRVKRIMTLIGTFCTFQEVEGEARSIAKCISVHILWHIKLVIIVWFWLAKPELDPHALTIENFWSLLTENKALLCL